MAAQAQLAPRVSFDTVEALERECAALEKCIDIYGWSYYDQSIAAEDRNSNQPGTVLQPVLTYKCYPLDLTFQSEKDKMNCVSLVGHLGKDPEVIQAGETQIAKFTMATSEYNTKTKSREAEWHNIVVFGKEAVVKLLKKGELVGIQGRLKTESWEDKKDNQKRYKTVIIANDLRLYGQGGNRAASAEASADSAPAPAPQHAPVEDDFEMPPF